MRRFLLPGAAAVLIYLFLFASPAMAQGVSMPGDEKLQIRVDYWLNELVSEVKVTSGSFLGTTVNAFDTLGMDVHMQTFVPVVLSYSRFGFRLEFWRNTYEGDKNLDEPVIFNGTLYPAGDHLQSKLVIDSYDVRAFLDLVPQKKLDVYPMGGLKYRRYEVWLDDLTTGDSENEILHAPLPFVGGGARLNLGQYISVGGELAVMNVTFTDYDLQIKDFMDFHAYAELHVTPNLVLVGGFRYTTFRILAKKDDVDYTLSESIEGLFFGAALMF
jgi:hypothetical protein